MTITDLQTKRECTLKGIARVQFENHNVRYADQEKALSIIDREIQIVFGPNKPLAPLAPAVAPDCPAVPQFHKSGSASASSYPKRLPQNGSKALADPKAMALRRAARKAAREASRQDRFENSHYSGGLFSPR